MNEAGNTHVDADTLRREARELFDHDADVWLKTPNEHLRGQTPDQLLDSGETAAVRNLLRLIKYVGST